MKYSLIIIIMFCILIAPAFAWGEVKIADNQTEIAQLQHLLDSYHFKYQWQDNVFDCVDMSAANYRFLKEHGYSPEIAIRKDPPRKDEHVYVFLPLKSVLVGVDTSIHRGADLTASLGKVITVLDMVQVCRTPEEVYAIDPRGPPVIHDEVIVPNNGTTNPVWPALSST